MFGWGLKCRKCQASLSIIKAQEHIKLGSHTGIIAECPKHGLMKQKFNNKLKEVWIDQFRVAVFRCTKCDHSGSPVEIEEKGSWTSFRIKCPIHGLTAIKQINSRLFHQLMVLQEKNISYEKYLELYHPKKYITCKICGHVIPPGIDICEECGESVDALDLDW